MDFKQYYYKNIPELKIGVVGFIDENFDVDYATRCVDAIYDQLELQYENHVYTVVSGWSNMGIPKLAYEEAVRRGWKTVGIACEKVKEYDMFPVNEGIIVGKEWGEESSIFLNSISVLVRIGGGKQSMQETKDAKEKEIPTFEYDLEREK